MYCCSSCFYCTFFLFALDYVRFFQCNICDAKPKYSSTSNHIKLLQQYLCVKGMQNMFECCCGIINYALDINEL